MSNQEIIPTPVTIFKDKCFVIKKITAGGVTSLLIEPEERPDLAIMVGPGEDGLIITASDQAIFNKLKDAHGMSMVTVKRKKIEKPKSPRK